MVLDTHNWMVVHHLSRVFGTEIVGCTGRIRHRGSRFQIERNNQFGRPGMLPGKRTGNPKVNWQYRSHFLLRWRPNPPRTVHNSLDYTPNSDPCIFYTAQCYQARYPADIRCSDEHQRILSNWMYTAMYCKYYRSDPDSTHLRIIHN